MNRISEPSTPEGSKSEKLCSVCGRDCSNRPRTKDRADRYVCKDCLDQAAATKAATERARHLAQNPTRPTSSASAIDDDTDNSLVLRLGEPLDTPRCPACAAPVRAPDAVLCTACGFDFRKGERHPLKIRRRP